MLHKAVRGALLVDTWLTRGARLFSCYDRHGSPPPYQMRHAVTCPISTDTLPTQITALWVVHARVQRSPRPCATLPVVVCNVVHGRVQRGAWHLVTEMSFAFIILCFHKKRLQRCESVVCE